MFKLLGLIIEWIFCLFFEYLALAIIQFYRRLHLTCRYRPLRWTYLGYQQHDNNLYTRPSVTPQRRDGQRTSARQVHAKGLDGTLLSMLLFGHQGQCMAPGVRSVANIDNIAPFMALRCQFFSCLVSSCFKVLER